jgi:mono/diheme cytochrome c family protein
MAEKSSDVLTPINYPTLNPSIQDGKSLYEKLNCAQCHGTDAAGIEGRHNLVDPVITYNRTPYSTYRNFGFLEKEHGAVKKGLTTQQLWDLIFYVRALAHPPLSPERIKELDPIFVANCSICHGKEGFGDGTLSHGLEPQPANFHRYARMFDREDGMLFNHMHDGLFPSAMPAWSGYKDSKSNVEFDDAFIRDMVQYVRHFHCDAGPGIGRWYDGKTDARSTGGVRP